MILLVRADERLIHGQTMQYIVPENSISKIIGVDDFTATNSLMKSIFQTAVPKHLSAEVFTAEESIGKIKEALKDDSRTMLLMKFPKTYLILRKEISELDNAINIGAQMSKNGIKCTEYASLSTEDISACEELTKEGIRVYFNAIGITGKLVEWSTVAKNLKL